MEFVYIYIRKDVEFIMVDCQNVVCIRLGVFVIMVHRSPQIRVRTLTIYPNLFYIFLLIETWSWLEILTCLQLIIGVMLILFKVTLNLLPKRLLILLFRLVWVSGLLNSCFFVLATSCTWCLRRQLIGLVTLIFIVLFLIVGIV